jgi:ABC-type branched-subunit amino acid transport system permease subunit
MRTVATVVFLVIVALLPLAVPWLQFVFTLALAHGLGALGVALLLRAGLISLGHATYYALGAYTTAYLSSRIGVTDFVLLSVSAILVSAAVGAIVGLFMVRYRSIFFAMLNLAVSMVLFAFLAKFYSWTGGTDGMRVAPPTLFGAAFGREVFGNILFYSVLLVVGIVSIIITRYLESPMGLALSAVHTNEVRLEYLGISVNRVLLSAYTLSAALAGLGGAIGGIAIGHVVPEMAYWTGSGHLVLVAVLGGIGGVLGPFIGSVFLEMVHTFATGYAAESWNLIVGLALLLVIFFLPQGLYGLGIRFAVRKEQPSD